MRKRSIAFICLIYISMLSACNFQTSSIAESISPVSLTRVEIEEDAVNSIKGIHLQAAEDSYPSEIREIDILKTNLSDYTVLYNSFDYHIQVYQEGEWFQLERTGSVIEPLEIWKPDVSTHQTLELDKFHYDYPPGRYRVVWSVQYASDPDDDPDSRIRGIMAAEFILA